jgi:hypothetical protein
VKEAAGGKATDVQHEARPGEGPVISTVALHRWGPSTSSDA